MGKAWWKGREARGSVSIELACSWLIVSSVRGPVLSFSCPGVPSPGSHHGSLPVCAAGGNVHVPRIVALAFHSFPKVPWLPTSSAFWGLCYKSDLFSWFFLLSPENLHLLNHYHSSFCFLLPKLWIFYFPVFSIFGVHLSKINCFALFLIGF